MIKKKNWLEIDEKKRKIWTQVLELGNFQGVGRGIQSGRLVHPKSEISTAIFLNFPQNATRLCDLTHKQPPLTNLVCREMRKVEPIKRSKAILERKIEAESRIEFVSGGETESIETQIETNMHTKSWPRCNCAKFWQSIEETWWWKFEFLLRRRERCFWSWWSDRVLMMALKIFYRYLWIFIWWWCHGDD